MNEAEIIKAVFSAGVWFGYAITTFVMCVGAMYIYSWRLSRVARFMREKNLLQSYADWSHKNKNDL